MYDITTLVIIRADNFIQWIRCYPAEKNVPLSLSYGDLYSLQSLLELLESDHMILIIQPSKQFTSTATAHVALSVSFNVGL